MHKEIVINFVIDVKEIRSNPDLDLDSDLSFQLEQGRIHGRFSRVLLGRGSNITVYTTSGARRVVTDCLHRSNSLIVPIWLVFALSN